MKIATALALLVLVSPAAAREPYHAADYAAARAAFRAGAAQLAAGWPGARVRAFAVPSRTDADLTVDSLWLPAAERADRLVVLTSGVHGMEAYAGSAVQRLFLAEFAGRLDRARTSYLVVHALNPFGFKHHRRATENNVNLNRNFSTKSDLYATANPGYAALASVLEPAGPVRSLARDFASLAVALGRRLLTGAFSLAALNQAIGEGQYGSPAGLEFGGRAAEPQVVDFLGELRAAMRGVPEVLLLDLHTGLGESGQLHLMPGDAEGVCDPALFRRAFDPQADAAIYAVTPNDTPGFYRTHGDVNNVLAELRSPEQRVVAVTLEFGTLGDSSLAKLRTLNRLVVENQGFHHGYASAAAGREARAAFAEQFFPADRAWRRNVIARARALFDRLLARLAP